ncbi:MAG: hypothetical protein GY778_11130 [bacterium]|nr:hypothetical protein [bacterium]
MNKPLDSFDASSSFDATDLQKEKSMTKLAQARVTLSLTQFRYFAL